MKKMTLYLYSVHCRKELLCSKYCVQFAVLIQTHEKVRTSIPLSINHFPTNYKVFRTLFVFLTQRPRVKAQ